MDFSLRKMLRGAAAGLAAAAVMLSGAFGVSAADLPPYDPDEPMPDFNVSVTAPPHIIFIGDSIISGYGLEGYSPYDKSKCESFVNILSRKFGEELPEQAGFTCINEGLDGRTSGELLTLLRSGELDESLGQADAVVISIGGNDMLGTFLSLLDRGNDWAEALGKAMSLSSTLDRDLDGFAANMPLIAEELDKRTEGEIFVQTLYNPMEQTSVGLLNRMSAEKIGRLNAVIEECSEEGKRYRVCDVASDFAGKANELTNIARYDIHPNAEGHKRIAVLLEQTIRSGKYSYYDYEAEKKYLEELAERKAYAEKLRLEEEQRARAEQERAEREARQQQEKREKTLIASGSGAAVLLAGGIAFASARKKKHAGGQNAEVS